MEGDGRSVVGSGGRSRCHGRVLDRRSVLRRQREETVCYKPSVRKRGSGNENGRWIGMESGPLPPRVVVGEVGGRRWLEEYE